MGWEMRPRNWEWGMKQGSVVRFSFKAKRISPTDSDLGRIDLLVRLKAFLKVIDNKQGAEADDMKIQLFILPLLWTVMLAVKGTDPSCDWCASNSLCLSNTCTCQGGGDPYFTCETSGYYYCSVRDSAVHTFSQDTADVWMPSPALLSQLTTIRTGINRGVCQFNVTTLYSRVENVIDVTEVELNLKQKDFLGIYTTVAVRIKSYVDNGVYVSEISFRPLNALNYTDPVFLRSTDQPLGSGQYVSYSCQLAYRLTSDNFTVVTIPCCGLELGFRPNNIKQPQVLSGVYLKVDPTRNPNYNSSIPQLCIRNY
ncbi:hypothetical protein Btru_074246 [Bulinus truncatus]|nr:hypothetical protein Btru_074246 [Bulinus truncatus]